MVTPDVSHETMLYPWHDSSYNKGLPSETHVGSSSVFSTVVMAPAELGLQFKVNLEKTFHSPRLSALQVGACAGTRKPNEQLEWSEARSHGIRLGYNFYQSTPPPHGAEEEAPRVKWHVDPSTLGTVSLGHALLTPAAREKCARIERAMLRYDADTLLATESGVLATALAQLEKHDARLVRAFTALQSVGGLSDNERHALQSALQSVHTSQRHVGPTRMSVQSTHAINVSHVGSTPPSLSHDESSQTGPTGKQTKAHLPIVGALNTAPKSRQSVLDTARALLKEHAAVHQATMMLVDRWDVAWRAIMAEAEGVRKAALHRMMEAATMVHAEMEEVELRLTDHVLLNISEEAERMSKAVGPDGDRLRDLRAQARLLQQKQFKQKAVLVSVAKRALECADRHSDELSQMRSSLDISGSLAEGLAHPIEGFVKSRRAGAPSILEFAAVSVHALQGIEDAEVAVALAEQEARAAAAKALAAAAASQAAEAQLEAAQEKEEEEAAGAAGSRGS
ncbi:hypothetical protein Ctob_014425, partial [Chrysochromulina tobinii]